MKPSLSILLLLLATTLCSFAQTKNTGHTLALDDNGSQQKASINDLAWLSGSWLGNGFGAVCEEAWSAPRSGGMMGMFQMIGEDGVVFYEMCQIVEKDGSLVLRLKHFNADLTGWETKEETVDFPLVKLEGSTAWFSGLTYQREGDVLNVWVAVEDKEGSVEEAYLKFELQK